MPLKLFIRAHHNEFGDIRFSWRFAGDDRIHPQFGTGASHTQLNRVMTKYAAHPRQEGIIFEPALNEIPTKRKFAWSPCKVYTRYT